MEILEAYLNYIGFFKKTKNWVTTFGLILVVSCSSHKSQTSYEVQAKPFNDTLQAHVVALQNDSTLLGPFHILNLNDHFLIITKLKKNNFIDVYSLPDMQFLYSWGHQGRGPNEFIQPPDYVNHKKTLLIIHDRILNELRSYQVDDSTLEKENRQALSYKLQAGALNNIQRINDSLYFATYGMSAKNMVQEYIALKPGDKKPLFTFSKYPDSELEGPKRYFQFIKTNVVKPDGSMFAVFYTHYNKFKIFNAHGKLVKEIHVHDSSIPQNMKDKKDIIFRNAAYASNKYIYTIGAYAPSKELDKNRSAFKTSLEIWDWAGNPIYRARFDASIQIFTVSEKHKTLYGIAASKKNSIFEYTLPDELDLK